MIIQKMQSNNFFKTPKSEYQFWEIFERWCKFGFFQNAYPFPKQIVVRKQTSESFVKNVSQISSVVQKYVDLLSRLTEMSRISNYAVKFSKKSCDM